MSKYLIRKEDTSPDRGSRLLDVLDINEIFYDTLQGEGQSTGYPAVFMRMQGCTLDCVWCDTKWRIGDRYYFDTVLGMMNIAGVADRLREGHRLILTGGSPLKQQDRLVWFLRSFQDRFRFIPVIEVENECTIIPSPEMISLVDVWNNSPKLASSGMKEASRIKKDVLDFNRKFLWGASYKFVVASEEDVKEILTTFVFPGYVRREQVILMPLAGDYNELVTNRVKVAKLAIQNSMRYCTREQLILDIP